MLTPERRQIPRTAMERLAYIDIEPNNGGIVLNVSPDGLCFHSIAPVVKNGPLHFSLLQQTRRIAACGELTWTDEIQKVGGMRFTTLTEEAREQIQDWIAQPADLPAEPKATLGSVLLKAFPKFRVRRSVPDPDSGSPFAFATAFPKTRVRIKLSGFAKGLATGLLISLLCMSVFLFYAERREIGQSIIHLGERLSGEHFVGERIAGERPTERPTEKPGEHSPSLLAPQTVSPTKSVSPGRNQTPPSTQSLASTQSPTNTRSPAHLKIPAPSQAAVQTQISVVRPKNSLARPLASPAQPQLATIKPQPSAGAASHTTNSSVPQPSAVRNSPETATPTTTASLGAPSSPDPNTARNAVATPSKPEPSILVQATGSYEINVTSLPQMYFELGKFKDELRARDLGDRISELGLRPSVVQKRHLWTNSFYVLVGPYTNQDEATKTHKDLLSHGYNPRPFERGSRDFAFVSGLTLRGASLPAGDFRISWESYVTDAKVKFAQGNYVLATATGQWVKRPVKYHQDEYVYERSRNGSRLLREIHFSGLDRALVFGNSS